MGAVSGSPARKTGADAATRMYGARNGGDTEGLERCRDTVQAPYAKTDGYGGVL